MAVLAAVTEDERQPRADADQLAFPVTLIVIESVAGDQDRSVNQTPPGEARQEDGLGFSQQFRDRKRIENRRILPQVPKPNQASPRRNDELKSAAD
jgi:hypothetical protein